MHVRKQGSLLEFILRLFEHRLYAGATTQLVVLEIQVLLPADFAAVKNIHDVRFGVNEAGFFGLVVDHRNKQAVRLHSFEQRFKHLVREEEVPFAEEFWVAVNAVELSHQRRIRGESPDAFLYHRFIARDHDDVRFIGRLIQTNVREHRIERF